MTLDELQKLCDKADPAPWIARIERTSTGLSDKMSLIGKDPYMPGEIDIMYYRHPEANIEFIAASRSAMPKLIAVARAAKEVDDDAIGYGICRVSANVLSRLSEALAAMGLE